MGKFTTKRLKTDNVKLAKDARALAQDGLFAIESVTHDVQVLRETLLQTIEALEEANRAVAEMDVSVTVVRILLARMGVPKEQFDEMALKVREVRAELSQAATPAPVELPPLPNLLADHAPTGHHPAEAFIFGG